MWKAVQLSIVLPIVWSNMVYGWTPNGYVPVLIGIFAARVLTGVCWRIRCWRRGIPVGEVRPFHENIRRPPPTPRDQLITLERIAYRTFRAAF